MCLQTKQPKIMKIQNQFKNASLVSATNGTIVVKDATKKKHTFTNASVVSVNNGTIIIKSEWKPKKGELIKIKRNNLNYYTIFRTIKNSILYDYGYKSLIENQIKCNNHGWDIENIIIFPVTQEEQEEFDDFCKSQGIIWNKEKLQWETYKWKPKIGELIYTIQGNGEILESYYDNSMMYYQKSIEIGNCFKTKEEAEIKLNQIKNLFKE